MTFVNKRITEIEMMFSQNLSSNQMVDLQKELGLLNKELTHYEDEWFLLNEELEKR